MTLQLVFSSVAYFVPFVHFAVGFDPAKVPSKKKIKRGGGVGGFMYYIPFPRQSDIVGYCAGLIRILRYARGEQRLKEHT